MKKSILNLGKQLNKNEQTLINGGYRCDQPVISSGTPICVCPDWSLHPYNNSLCSYTALPF